MIASVATAAVHSGMAHVVKPVDLQDEVYTYIKEFRGPPTPLQLCLPVVTGEEIHPQFTESVQSNGDDPFHNPLIIPKRVTMFVQRWGRVVAMDPVIFLHNILEKRGYDTDFIPNASPERRK